MLIGMLRQELAGSFVESGHSIIARKAVRAIARSAGQNFPAQPAALVNLEQVDRYMRGPQAEEMPKRILPAFGRLMRQACNQVEADVGDARIAQSASCRRDIGAAMHPAGGNKLGITEWLHAEADAVDPRCAPGGGFLRRHRFRVGLERDLFELAAEAGSHRVEDARQRCRGEEARRTATDVYGVHGKVRFQSRVGIAAECRVLSQFAADGTCVRIVEALREHSRMEIAVGALGLAERDLDVDADVHAHAKNTAETRKGREHLQQYGRLWGHFGRASVIRLLVPVLLLFPKVITTFPRACSSSRYRIASGTSLNL